MYRILNIKDDKVYIPVIDKTPDHTLIKEYEDFIDVLGKCTCNEHCNQNSNRKETLPQT